MCVLSFSFVSLFLIYICTYSTYSFYSDLILVLTRFLFYPYCYSRCGRLSSYSLSKGKLLYSFIFVHIPYFYFLSQATFILGESSETILLFDDSGGSEVGHVPLDVRNG